MTPRDQTATATLSLAVHAAPSTMRGFLEVEQLLAPYDDEQQTEILEISRESGLSVRDAVEAWWDHHHDTATGMLAQYLTADELARTPFPATHRLRLGRGDAQYFGSLPLEDRCRLVRAAVDGAMAEGWPSPAAVLPAILQVVCAYSKRPAPAALAATKRDLLCASGRYEDRPRFLPMSPRQDTRPVALRREASADVVNLYRSKVAREPRIATESGADTLAARSLDDTGAER